jgi:hypothetical protein
MNQEIFGFEKAAAALSANERDSATLAATKAYLQKIQECIHDACSPLATCVMISDTAPERVSDLTRKTFIRAAGSARDILSLGWEHYLKFYHTAELCEEHVAVDGAQRTVALCADSFIPSKSFEQVLEHVPAFLGDALAVSFKLSDGETPSEKEWKESSKCCKEMCRTLRVLLASAKQKSIPITRALRFVKVLCK